MAKMILPKRSAPYWSNPPFLFFDFQALWRAPGARMSLKIKNGGLDQYGAERYEV